MRDSDIVQPFFWGAVDEPPNHEPFVLLASFFLDPGGPEALII